MRQYLGECATVSTRRLTRSDAQVSVFHSFLGLGVQAELSAKPIPGVFKVVWEGGVRYRNSPNYTDIADQEQLALPGTEFEIAEFERGCEANSKVPQQPAGASSP